MLKKALIATAATTTAAAAGGTLGYAYVDPEFRRSVEARVPTSRAVFAAVLGDKSLDKHELRERLNDLLPTALKQRLASAPHSTPPPPPPPPAPALTTSGESRSAAAAAAAAVVAEQRQHQRNDEKSHEEPDKHKHPLAVAIAKPLSDFVEEIVPVDLHKPSSAEQKQQSSISERAVAKPAATAEELARATKDLEKRLLSELESVEAKVRAASAAKQRTIDAIKEHSVRLKKAVDESADGDWDAVNAALEKAQSLAEADLLEESSSRRAIDALRMLVANAKANKATAGNRLVLSVSESALKLSHQLDELNLAEERARNESRIFNQYKRLVEKSREQFARELASIVPGLDAKAREDTLTKEELNTIIAHAYNRVDQVRREMAKQQMHEEQKIANAIEQQRKADEALARAQLEDELRRARELNLDTTDRRVADERRKWEVEVQRVVVECEPFLIEVPRRQLELVRSLAAIERSLAERTGCERVALRELPVFNYAKAELLRYYVSARGTLATLNRLRALLTVRPPLMLGGEDASPPTQITRTMAEAVYERLTAATVVEAEMGADYRWRR